MPKEYITARIAEARRILNSSDSHQSLKSIAYRFLKGLNGEHHV